jgi:hypothetical protein
MNVVVFIIIRSAVACCSILDIMVKGEEVEEEDEGENLRKSTL